MTVVARITCETLPGLLRAFHTASDKSWGGGLETRLGEGLVNFVTWSEVPGGWVDVQGSSGTSPGN